MIILPKKSPNLEDYKTLADTWKHTQEVQGMSLQIILDDELDKLPEDQSLWVIGFENKFASEFNILEEYRAAFDEAQTQLFVKLKSEGSLVYSIPNPANDTYTLGFIGTNVKQAVPGLTRLLSHYGKYSFLGFEGERPNNVLKGNFPALHSPLFYTLAFQIINRLILPSLFRYPHRNIYGQSKNKYFGSERGFYSDPEY